MSAPCAVGREYPTDLHVIQFAIGGRVFPPRKHWIKIAERFRGAVLKACAERMLCDSNARYRDLAPRQKAALQLLSGKDEDGKALEGHRHAYFIVWPDTNGEPTRLVCYRTSAFEPHEIEAVLQASRRQYAWESGNPDWLVRLVPLPFSTTAPPGFGGQPARTWVSRTPFIPPANRHRFRKNGRERPGEMPDQILRKLLLKQGFPEPDRVEPLRGDQPVEPKSLADWSAIHEWVDVHETGRERARRRRERTRAVRPGFRFRVAFKKAVPGPLVLGHSCHFGLGVFEAES
jgi:CRISPR-associated protein Csb2